MSHCAEVERVLDSDPEVIEVALFGVPDERMGERAIAAVNLREGSARSEDELRAVAKAELADYKIPAEFVFDFGTFPRNVTGKVEKPKLKAWYLERAGEPV